VTTNETGRTHPGSRPAAVDPDGESELEDDVFEANEVERDEPEPSADGDTVVEGEPLDTEPSTAESPGAEPLPDEPSTAAPSTTAERAAEEPQPEADADDATAHAAAATAAAPGVDEAFLADAGGYQDRWNEIQTGFVDEPSRAVQSAGDLLTELVDDLARTLATDLETFGARGGARDEASTEDLRVVFQRYRAYFDRLLAV
jgi:hypothetical protein